MNAVERKIARHFTPATEQGKCPRAEHLVAVARDFSFEATSTYGQDDEGNLVDVALQGNWSEWDDDNVQHGWKVGFAVRWYRTERGWRLAQLDGRNGRPVGGVAQRFDDNREVTFWLSSVRYLESVLDEPDTLIEWLDGRPTESGPTPAVD